MPPPSGYYVLAYVATPESNYSPQGIAHMLIHHDLHLFYGRVPGGPWVSPVEAMERAKQLAGQIENEGVPSSMRLRRIPDDEFYPPWRTFYKEMTEADMDDPATYLKYPDSDMLLEYIRGVPVLRRLALACSEIDILEAIALSGGHPNIVEYCGVFHVSGLIRGLCLRKYSCSLYALLEGQVPEAERPPYDPKVIFADIQSAVKFLHKNNLAHTRIGPKSIWIDKNGRGILTELGECVPLLTPIDFTNGWNPPPFSDPVGTIAKAKDFAAVVMLGRRILGQNRS